MNHRVVEITREDARLNLHRGFLVVSSADGEIGRIALGDIGALIIRGHGTSLSVAVCSAFAERSLPVVICGSDQQPDAVIWPIDGHFEQGKRMQAQAEASLPVRKRLWREVVRAKIRTQAGILDLRGVRSNRLRQMERAVRSGDPGNIEGQAARYYWPMLMGAGFRRERSSGGINARLNYGYTVLRSATARSILAAGLHPSLSLHHESRGTALRLADDLMEPFRPYVDFQVARLIDEGETDELSPAMKATLAAVLTRDLAGPKGVRPLQTCLDAMALSLARVFTGEVRKLDLPGEPLPMDLAST